MSARADPLAARLRASLIHARRTAVVRGPAWVLTQGVVTVVTAGLIAFLVVGITRWALWTADWAVVSDNLRLFSVGTYAKDELWRPAAALAIFSALLGVSAPVWGSILWDLARALAAGLMALLVLPLLSPLLASLQSEQLAQLAAAFLPAAPALVAALVSLVFGVAVGRAARRRVADNPRVLRRTSAALRVVWLASLPGLMLLLRGAAPATIVPVDRWGGLLLTLILAVAAIAASFPLGVMLALGRRSGLPLVKVTCVGYIELVRAVPLVTLLFMASLMLPLVLPDGIRPSSVLRALAGLTLFSAAYVAEDVRGGLAAVDRGQYEASKAVGLGSFATYRLVVLPQALRTVIPAIVGQFISLFKDTSLVIIIGLRELLGIAQAVVNQPEHLGLYREVLVFISIIYFAFSTVMARASRHLERESSGGST